MPNFCLILGALEIADGLWEQLDVRSSSDLDVSVQYERIEHNRELGNRSLARCVSNIRRAGARPELVRAFEQPFFYILRCPTEQRAGLISEQV